MQSSGAWELLKERQAASGCWRSCVIRACCVFFALVLACLGVIFRMQNERHEVESAEMHTVWSRGLARACDLYQRDLGSYAIARHYDIADYRALFEPSMLAEPIQANKRAVVVHVGADAFPQWLQEVWPVVKVPMVLLTSDSAVSLPCSAFPGPLAAQLQAFLGDPRLVHWFTQNLDWDPRGSQVECGQQQRPLQLDARLTSKVSPVPIGVDFETLAEEVKPGVTLPLAGYSYSLPRSIFGTQTAKWGTPHTTTFVQQGVIDTLAASLPANHRRPARALVDWSHSEVGDRASLLAQLPRGTHWEAHDNLQRAQMWEMHGAFAFVVSPPGRGLDTHRTWEALALHSIPIVLRNTLHHTGLYEGLPVVGVNSFEEVTEENLQKWHRELAPLFEKPEATQRIEQQWWVDRILEAATKGAAV